MLICQRAAIHNTMNFSELTESKIYRIASKPTVSWWIFTSLVFFTRRSEDALNSKTQ
ncbi:hypothetical protein [Campylobacter troglodytis]|uniref:hypothetical protein n=1 Tax=Campylobacter troglodytis TaxID=654363 RepID=UPI00163D20E6|nr:hypothetical protein [Campylobacter troglodytis]